MIRPNYDFCVIAALQEELNEFISIMNKYRATLKRSEGKIIASLKINGVQTDILLYTANRMGMPYNASAITKVLMTYECKYVFFIGTCAGLGNKNKVGDVLVPDRVFTYESGKHENGQFRPDDLSYETSQILRQTAEQLNHEARSLLSYRVVTDEDMCSGAAVIDDEKLAKEIVERSARKVTGLDMESYALACINRVFNGQSEVSVIKSIMDYAKKKGESEGDGNKELAKKNSADFAFRMIEYLISSNGVAPAEDDEEKSFTLRNQEGRYSGEQDDHYYPDIFDLKEHSYLIKFKIAQDTKHWRLGIKFSSNGHFPPQVERHALGYPLFYMLRNPKSSDISVGFYSDGGKLEYENTASIKSYKGEEITIELRCENNDSILRLYKSNSLDIIHQERIAGHVFARLFGWADGINNFSFDVRISKFKYERNIVQVPVTSLLDDKTALIYLEKIKAYLFDKGFSMISVDGISKYVDPAFNEGNLDTLLNKFPDQLRRAKLKGNKSGVKFLGSKEPVLTKKTIWSDGFQSENKWIMNYWGSRLPKKTNRIENGKMVFEALPSQVLNIDGYFGAYIDLSNDIINGKVYEIACKVKSDINTTMKFSLWVHDINAKKSRSIMIPNPGVTPSTNEELIKVVFQAAETNKIRIHLHCKAGAGRISVSEVRVSEIV